MMKHVLYCAAILLAACSCRNARSAEVNKALQELGQTTENPTMAVVPDDSTEDGLQVGEVVEFDKTVHDFGDISIDDGPQTCVFTVKNIGKDPIAIYEVVTSCGCTDAQWTREPLQPGKTGKISATYKNEDGPVPFDKTLTVYIAGVSKPVILRLRGLVHEKKKPISELYGAVKLGSMGLKSLNYKVSNVLQGESSSDEAKIANLGKQPMKVSFTNVSPNLTIEVVPATVPAGETAALRFSVKADPALWGKHVYSATPVINGTKAAKPVTVTALTRGNFASWTPEQRKNAAQCIFDESTVSFGTVQGQVRPQVLQPGCRCGRLQGHPSRRYRRPGKRQHPGHAGHRRPPQGRDGRHAHPDHQLSGPPAHQPVPRRANQIISSS